MKKKKLVTPAPVGAGGDDLTTWALPKGAIARLGQGMVQTLAFSPDGHHRTLDKCEFRWVYPSLGFETLSVGFPRR